MATHERALGKIRIEMVDPQSVILREIADKAVARDSVALTYAFCIRQRNDCEFPVINRAIIDRWSPSALEYIKTKAWRFVEGKETP